MNATLHLVVTMVLCALVVRPLAAARWVWRSPRTGILLWQLLGLTFLLCAVGAALTHGLAPYDRDVPTALGRLLAGVPVPLGPDRVTALMVAALVTIVLVEMVVLSWLAVLGTRRRHRRVLAIVGREDPAAPGALILDHPVTVAYCLPGRRSTVVLSSGALRRGPGGGRRPWRCSWRCVRTTAPAGPGGRPSWPPPCGGSAPVARRPVRWRSPTGRSPRGCTG